MTLFMRDQENIEKGREEGIHAMVITLKGLGISEDIILEKSQEGSHVTMDEAYDHLKD